MFEIKDGSLEPSHFRAGVIEVQQRNIIYQGHVIGAQTRLALGLITLSLCLQHDLKCLAHNI